MRFTPKAEHVPQAANDALTEAAAPALLLVGEVADLVFAVAAAALLVVVVVLVSAFTASLSLSSSPKR